MVFYCVTGKKSAELKLAEGTDKSAKQKNFLYIFKKKNPIDLQPLGVYS